MAKAPIPSELYLTQLLRSRSLTEVASQLCVEEEVLVGWLTHYGATLSYEDRKQIRHLVASGTTVEEVAEELNLAVSAINKIIRI